MRVSKQWANWHRAQSRVRPVADKWARKMAIAVVVRAVTDARMGCPDAYKWLTDEDGPNAAERKKWSEMAGMRGEAVAYNARRDEIIIKAQGKRGSNAA